MCPHADGSFFSTVHNNFAAKYKKHKRLLSLICELESLLIYWDLLSTFTIFEKTIVHEYLG